MAQQLRLVIADDESLIRMNLKETLVGLGYLVVGEAGDGVSVVNLARELRPDLVVMDIKMPKLDGVQRAKGVMMDTQGLKEQEAFRKIQQLSMNTRKSMREIAQAILLTAQIEK